MDELRVDTPARLWLRDRCARFLTAGVILALLYVGQDVLIPLVVAIMLSLLVAPFVRALRRVGMGRMASVLVVVLILTISCLAAAVVLGTQVVRIAESLPRYEANLEHKLETADALTGRRLRLLTSEASQLLELRETAHAIAHLAAPAEDSTAVSNLNVIESDAHHPGARPLPVVGRLLRSVWASIQSVSIVLLVLVFVLLEHESLRDRFIRLVSATDIRLATFALNDAGERLSRFFVSQCAVNLGFGMAIASGLSLLHVPQAMLFGAVAGIMRLAPYVGTGLTALLATTYAFVVDPGWSVAAGTLTVFILLDLIVGQFVEPHLYGHATGLSPLSVVVASIFWSSLWGPIGLVLSVPLTLCLVVASRHVKALGSLELLLSDAQPLTLAQKFYQRALSGDPHELIRDSRAFLKRNSLAAYCDRVLIPALHFACLDADRGAATEDQQLRIRRAIVDVVSALSNDPVRLPRQRYRGSVLERENAGQSLRWQREQLSGRWQGPLGVSPGSVVICLGLGSSADDLVAELLARVLIIQKMDARHFSLGELLAGLPPGADPDGVSTIFLVSAFPSPGRERVDSLDAQAQGTFPRAHVIRIFCPGIARLPNAGESTADHDRTVGSLVQAIQMCTASPRPHSAKWHRRMHEGRTEKTTPAL